MFDTLCFIFSPTTRLEGNVCADDVYFILLPVFFPLHLAHSIKFYFVSDNSYSNRHHAYVILSAVYLSPESRILSCLFKYATALMHIKTKGGIASYKIDTTNSLLEIAMASTCPH